MVYKIYKSNNYIIVIDENDNYFEEHCANVLVTKLLTPSTTYNITFFRPENTPQAFYNVAFADIRQQSGAPYANVAAWESWYTLNTGLCSNAAVLNSILATLQAQTDVEGVFVKDTGNLDKIVLQVKVWDQDSQTYIATYYYNPDGSLYTPVGPLEWVGTAGSVNATIINPLGDTTACSDAVAVTLCSAQATELFDQGVTLDSILTELTTGTLDVNITNSTLAVTQSGTWTIALDAATLLALETITVDQGTSPWIISATDLDIRDLDFTTDSVDVTGSDVTVSNTVTVQATALDVRALTCTDEVSLCANGTTVNSGNPLPVDAGALTPSADGVGMYGSTDGGTNWTAVQVDTNGVVSTNTTIVGPLGPQLCADSVAVSLCTDQAQNLEDIKTAVQGTLDVNILSSIELEVNLDPNNDAVTIYGSNPTVPVSTDGAGHLQVDVLTIPEVEIKNDAGNPIPVSGTVTANQGTNPWIVGQLTHDNLNANANIQVNNTDASATNPVPVLQQYPITVPYASCEVATGTGTTPVVFSAGATSMSVQNIGNDNITVDTDASSGVILPPGVSITWDAPVGQRFDTFTFTGSSVSSLFIVTAVIAS